jgi:hypothetical protein
MNMKIYKTAEVRDELYQTPAVEVIMIEIEQNILQSASSYTAPLNDVPDISGDYW